MEKSQNNIVLRILNSIWSVIKRVSQKAWASLRMHFDNFMKAPLWKKVLDSTIGILLVIIPQGVIASTFIAIFSSNPFMGFSETPGVMAVYSAIIITLLFFASSWVAELIIIPVILSVALFTQEIVDEYHNIQAQPA